MRYLTTGQLAKEAGVNIETIRYYERRGLLPKVPRRASGYRQYPPDMVRRIRFIKHAQALGFSLKEISELLSLRLDKNTPCYEVKRRAEAKIKDIEEKIENLKRMKKALARLTSACSGKGTVLDCPILEALDN